MRLFRLSCELSCFRELLFSSQLDEKRWQDNISNPKIREETLYTRTHWDLHLFGFYEKGGHYFQILKSIESLCF